MTAEQDWAGPVALVDVELSEPITGVDVGARYSRALLLVRDAGRPVGRIEVALTAGRLSAEACARAIHDATPASGWPPAPPVPQRLPPATVVVCTRDRGDSALATVASFEALDYDAEIDIIVVDNAPTDDVLRDALSARDHVPGRPVRRVVEPVPGLSQARNRALAVASGEIIAFTDDDAIVEPQWLRSIAAAMSAADDVAGVSGLTIPAEMETPAQEWCERLGGLNKGRGFARETYRADDLGGRHPLYPFPTLGAGVNMAFRRDVLAELGGFSHALGVGNGTGGGEDTAIFALLLIRGFSIVYEPAAVVRHAHRRSLDDLIRQMHGYGVGVTSYLAWCLHRHPRESLGLVRMVRPALRYMLTRGGSHETADAHPVPGFLTAELRRGLPEGPMAYVRAERADRRLRRGAAGHDPRHG